MRSTNMILALCLASSALASDFMNVVDVRDRVRMYAPLVDRDGVDRLS